ncbi:unnamed protein product, partial [Adineta steineri]
MLINHTKRILTQPQTTSFILIFKKHNSSTTKSTKLTSSYFHHVSPLQLQYKTISQSFDETADKYPD